MSSPDDLDPRLPAEEREQLALLAERLRRDRPLPTPAFRGDLRRQLLARRRPETAAAVRFRLRAASSVAAGCLCLLVAAAGLAGIGPFAA